MKESCKKIQRLLLTTDTVGGVWTYAIELACALQSHSIEVALATMGAPISRQQRNDLHTLDRTKVFESSYKLEWMQDPWNELDAAGNWLLELEEKFDPDIVHLNQYAFGSLPWRSAVVVSGHSCVLSWWSAVHGSPAPETWNQYKKLVTLGLRKANAIVAPSHEMRKALSNHYGPLSINVIHNGRDQARFKCGPKEELILSVGRIWDAAKNISMVARMASSFPWPVCVAGDQGDVSIHHPNVRYMGKLGSGPLRRLFAKAAIYVLPAKYEPFGLSILEAALSRCALVLGDIPSLRELWDGAAIFVNPDEPAGLKRAVDQLTSSRTMLQQYSDAAFNRAQSYSSERMCDQYLILYDSLQAKKSADAILPAAPEINQPFISAR